MRINVAFVGCNRPEYSRRVLQAIFDMDGFDGKVFGSLDRQKDGTLNDDMIDLLKEFKVPFAAPKVKTGCNANVFQALSFAWADGPDAVLVVEDDVVLEKSAWKYFTWAARTFYSNPNIRTVSAWRHENGWLPPAKLPENEYGRAAMQSHFSCWGWLTWKDRWEEMKQVWTTDTTDSHQLSWDVVMSETIGDRYEVCPAISLSNNIGEKGGTHRGAAHPGVLNSVLGQRFWLDGTATIPRKKTAYVILGRFGDILMVCKQLKRPSIIVCHKQYRSIVDELFPQHEVFEITSNPHDPISAANYAASKLKGHKIVLCQQHGMGVETTQRFRSYQSQQEFMANVL